MAVRTNLITNPSAETNATNWTLQGTGTTVTRVTSQFYVGTASIQVVAAAVANAGVLTPTATIGASVAVSGSISLRGNAGTEAVTVELRNQAGTVIDSTADTLSTSWKRYAFSGTTPVGTTSVHIRVNRVASTPAQTYFADAALIEASSIEGDYFDGSFSATLSATYAWTGTAHASTSTATDTAPMVVTGWTDANPAPRVDVTVTVVTGAVTTMTVWRDYGVGSPQVVRGALKAAASGGMFVTDYDAPLNTPITYTAVGYNVSGVAVTNSTAPATVTLTETSLYAAWVSDPLDPTAAVKVILEGKNGETSEYPADSAVLRPIGRSSGILVSGTRSSASAVPISLITQTLTDSDELADILNQANPVCLRPALSTRLPQLSYPSVPAPQKRVLMDRVTTIWSWTADLVSPPSAAIAVPVRTWGDLVDAYPTWGQVVAAQPTWLDVLRNQY